jgi:phosphate-selective porin OprO/OprP
LPTYKDTPQLTFFSYATGVVADGRRERWSPQFSYYVGGLTVYGEFARSNQAIRKDKDPSTTSVANDAWELTAAVLLTGEKSAPDPVKPNNVRPRKPFDPKLGHWGALELVGRVTGLSIDPKVFAGGFADPVKSARKASSWAVGLNWYLNRNIKQVVDFDHTSFSGGAAQGDRQTDDAILIRTQLSF